MSIWSAVVTPGVVAAIVTIAFNWWIQRPRADLRMDLAAPTVDDADRLLRANRGSGNWIYHPHWQPRAFVRLTNYGDGTAYDIRLSGSECRPRVHVGDSGMQKTQDEPPTVAFPLWSTTLSALEPGQSVNVLVMASPDPSRPKPVVEASWP